VVWEPFKGELCLSGGKDGQVKMWDMGLNCLKVFSSHTAAVTKVIWGGQGLIYSASEDRLIKVWKENGSWIRDLKGHGHWVNTMAVHTDFVLRNGAHEMGKVNGEIKKKYRIFK
jgi:ribosome assembly protein 4